MVLALRHPGAPDLDGAAARRLARSRAISGAIATQFGASELSREPIVTVYGWGMDRGGRRWLRAADRAARAVITEEPDCAGALDVVRASVWRDEAGAIQLVGGSGAATVVGKIPASGMLDTGNAFRALLAARPFDRESRHLQFLLAAARFDLAPRQVPVAGCLAILREPLLPADLAWVLGTDEQGLTPVIETLISQRLLTCQGGKISVARQADRLGLTALMLPETVQHWQRRRAELVAATSASRSAVDLCIAARHAARAEAPQLAASLWRAAASRALAAGQNQIAAGALRRARAIAAHCGDPDEHIEILADLGSLLRNMRSGADAEVMRVQRACLRLLPLARRTAERRFDILFGMQASHLVRGEIDQALEIGRRLLSEADQRADATHRLLAYRMTGLTALMAGDLAAARRNYHHALGLCDAIEDDTLERRFGSNQKALALAGLAWWQAVAAPSDSAHRLSEAWSWTTRLGHPHTTAHVATVLATRAQLAGRPGQAARFAAAALDVAERHHFQYWAAWADVVLGWCESISGAPRPGSLRLEKGITAYLRTGALQAMPFFLLLKADIALQTGDLSRAAVTLARAERYTRPGGTSFYRAEVLRTAAQVAARTGDEGRALHLLRKAYHTAVRQGAELFCQRAVAQLTAMKIRSGDFELSAVVK